MLKNNITRPCWPVLCLLSFLGFTGCSSPTTSKDGPPLHTSTINFNSIPNAQPRALPRSRYGNPRSYVVRGERYRILKTARNYDKRGIASWYGKKFHGRLTSSRETYNMFAMTGASRTLPIPSFVRVTNLENGHSVIVKINDRGPFVDNRIVDLSYAAAEKLGYSDKGTALVEVKTVTPSLSEFNRATQSTNTPYHPTLYLQLGAFREHHHAIALRERLSAVTRKNVTINTGTFKNLPIYRVQIGPLLGVTESDYLQHKLKQLGFQAVTTVHTHVQNKKG